MKRNRHGPTVTDGLMFGHEEVAVMDLFTPRSALSGTPLVFQSAKLLDHVQDAIDFVIPWQPVFRRQWKRSASLRVPHPEHFHARVLPPVLEENNLQAGCDRVLADGTWNSTLLLPRAEGNRSGWQWLHRLVTLSGLGWAVVLAAVLWELFALAFSKCAGWGWDKGAFFFAWGLGILALGFYLRTSTKRPACSRFFLGVNAIMLTVLSLVVATR
jgi:hypothetical protein